MGSSATIIGVVALATGLVGLLCGYLWGRSNVKAQVEDAVEQARRSADAREFALREELEEKMMEIAKFRVRAEDRPRSQGQREQLNLEQIHGSAGDTTKEQVKNVRGARKLPGQKQVATPRAIDSTEETIQNLLKSMEEKLKQPEQEIVTPKIAPPPLPPAKLPAEEPAFVTQKSTIPPPARLPAVEPQAVAQQSTRPAPAPSPAVKQPAPVKDEWQDFAASLEALTRRTK